MSRPTRRRGTCGNSPQPRKATHCACIREICPAEKVFMQAASVQSMKFLIGSRPLELAHESRPVGS